MMKISILKMNNLYRKVKGITNIKRSIHKIKKKIKVPTFKNN